MVSLLPVGHHLGDRPTLQQCLYLQADFHGLPLTQEGKVPHPQWSPLRQQKYSRAAREGISIGVLLAGFMLDSYIHFLDCKGPTC